MIPRTITIVEKGAVPRGFKRFHRRAAKLAFEAIGGHWHQHHRPKHFTRRAFSEYGYLPRSRAYNRRKRWRMGHERPGEFTGESKRRTATARIVAKHNEGLVRMNAPGLNRRPKNGRINLREELMRISAGEATKLSQVWAKRHEKGLHEIKESTTTKL